MLPILLAPEASLPGGQGAIEESQEHLQLLLRVQRSQWADGECEETADEQLPGYSTEALPYVAAGFCAYDAVRREKVAVLPLVWVWGHLFR